jgi:tetratricopeptide (TPR) repeat protein
LQTTDADGFRDIPPRPSPGLPRIAAAPYDRSRGPASTRQTTWVIPSVKRRLNFKLLVVLAVVTSVLGGTVHVVHGFQVRRNARALLKRSQQAEKQGDRTQAVGYLGRYLNLAPGDTDAMAKYGLALDELAQSPRGKLQPFLVLEQVLRRQPGRHDVRRRIVRIAMELGREADARPHIEFLLKNASPDDAELEGLLAKCLADAGDYEQAASLLEEATRHAPQMIENYVAEADLARRRLNQPQRGDQVMDELIRANGRSGRAYLARWGYRTAFGLAGAADDVARAQELAPDDPDVLVAAAAAAVRRGDLDEARKLLERGVSLHPRHGRMYQARADLEIRAGRLEAAVESLRQGLAALPADTSLRWSLAELLVEVGRPDEVEALIGRLRADKFPPISLEVLEAALLVKQQQWSAAARALERVRPHLEEQPTLAWKADLLLGQCYEQLGNPDLQLAAYRRALKAAPQDTRAQLGQATALLALGQFDDALGDYQRLIPAVPDARLVVAQLLLAGNRRRPADRRQWGDIERLLDEADRATPATAAVPILRAEVLMAQGRLDGARTLLETARDEQPKRVEFWVALAALAQRGATPQEALPILDEAQRRLGDIVDLRLARAQYWADRGGDDAAKSLKALAEGLDGFADEDRWRLLRGLTAANARLGIVAEARRLWTLLAQGRPTDLTPWTALFDLALQGGDEATATRALDEIRRIEGPDGTSWRYGRVRLLARQAGRGDKRSLDEARSLLTEIVARRPSWSAVPLARAQIEEAAGHPAEALPHYLKAIDLGERSPQIIGRAAQLLYAYRRYAEADQVIRKLPEPDAALPGDLHRLAAEVALKVEDPARALEQARKAVPDQSSNYRDHVWLGELLWAAGRPAEAEPALRRAVELGADRPEPWVALVQYLALTDRKADAEATITKAGPALSGDASRLALARCYEMIGRLDRAEQTYRAALSARPDDPAALRGLASLDLLTGRMADAEPLFRRLMALKTAAPQDAAWARRTLAMALATGGNYQRTREAMTILGLPEEGGRQGATGDTPAEDLRAQSVVLAAQRDRRHRREAIRILEGLGGRVPLTADDQFLLARLYEKDGDWVKARQQMLGLLASHGNNAQYLVSYTNALLRQHHGDEAQLWFDKLEALKPQPLSAANLAMIRAQLLAERGRKDEAAALLKAQVGADTDRVKAIAAALDQLGLDAAAEEMYRAYADQAKAPEATLVLAQYLGRHGHTPEALDLCERAWSTCPPEAVARVGVAVLDAAPSADDQQRRRLESRLEAALREHPDSTSLVDSLAILRNLQERYQEAEDLYRQALAGKGQDIVALNNLAWLLALKQGKGTEALGLLGRAVEVAGPIPDLRDTRAIANMVLGRGDLAVEDLEEAVAESPAPRTYFHLARAYQLTGNRVAAAAALRQAEAAGLNAAALHPLERPAYQRLRDELARK